MRAFVTGATGFIGGHVARKLRERGDDVVALVRSPEKAGELRELGCELVEGDLSTRTRSAKGVRGLRRRHPRRRRSTRSASPRRSASRCGTPTCAAPSGCSTPRIDAGVGRIVYVSTCNVFGNTHGKVVDESYRRDESEGFLSFYDETKYRAHEVAEDRIGKGYPIVIVQPGGVYGPNDHSEVGNMIDQARAGKLEMKMFPEMGLMLVLRRGRRRRDPARARQGRGRRVLRPRRASKGTMGELVDKVCEMSGRKPPRATMPAALMKSSCAARSRDRAARWASRLTCAS